MTGDNWISEMSSVIKKEKITHLILEREPYKKWYQLRTPYPFEKLIKKCEDIDIYILSKESSIKRKRKISTAIKRPNFTASLTNYVTSILITISFTILLYPLLGTPSSCDLPLHDNFGHTISIFYYWPNTHLSHCSCTYN